MAQIGFLGGRFDYFALCLGAVSNVAHLGQNIPIVEIIQIIHIIWVIQII